MIEQTATNMTTTKVFVDRFPFYTVPTLCLLRRRVHLSRELTDDVVRARAYMIRKQHYYYGGGGYYEVETRFDGDGFLRAWHENGTHMAQTAYINGKQHGLALTWHPTGTLAEELTYINGNEHGIMRAWHDNGTLEKEFTCINGSRHGRARWWREDGSLEQEVEYVHGEVQQ